MAVVINSDLMSPALLNKAKKKKLAFILSQNTIIFPFLK